MAVYPVSLECRTRVPQAAWQVANVNHELLCCHIAVAMLCLMLVASTSDLVHLAAASFSGSAVTSDNGSYAYELAPCAPPK